MARCSLQVLYAQIIAAPHWIDRLAMLSYRTPFSLECHKLSITEQAQSQDPKSRFVVARGFIVPRSQDTASRGSVQATMQAFYGDENSVARVCRWTSLPRWHAEGF